MIQCNLGNVLDQMGGHENEAIAHYRKAFTYGHGRLKKEAIIQGRLSE